MQEAMLAPENVKTAASREFKSMAKENREDFNQMLGNDNESQDDDEYEYYQETERTARKTINADQAAD